MKTKEYAELTARLDRIEQMATISAKTVLNLKEAAAFIGYTTQWLYRMTARKDIPYYKRGVKLYFKKSDLEEWMTGRRVMSDEEINGAASLYVATHKNK